MSPDNGSKTTGWDKAKIVIGALATVLLPLVIFIEGNRFSQSLAEQESSARMLELAIDILREDPQDINSDLWKWAASEFSEYTDEEIRAKVEQAFTKNFVRLPVAREPETAITSYIRDKDAAIKAAMKSGDRDQVKALTNQRLELIQNLDKVLISGQK